MKTKYLPHAAIMISMAASCPNAFSEEPMAGKPKMEEKTVIQKGSLTATIGDSVTFSTLAKALKATGLDLTLGNKGEYTVFAPTDEAFGKLPADVLTKLMLPENKEKLRSLLLYHVIAGRMTAADLKKGEVKTMNGEKVKVDVDGAKIELDGSKVFSVDVLATNGVMHTMGTVLVPKSLKGLPGLDK